MPSPFSNPHAACPAAKPRVEPARGAPRTPSGAARRPTVARTQQSGPWEPDRAAA